MKVVVTALGLGLAGAGMDPVETLDVACAADSIGDDVEAIFGLVGERLGAALASVRSSGRCAAISIEVRP